MPDSTARSERPGRHAGIHLHARSRFWCFSYRAPDGRWLHRTTGETAKKAAKDARQKFLLEIKAGLAPTDKSKWIVARAADHWLAWRKASGRHRRTYQYDCAMLGAVKDKLGSLRMDEITGWTVKDYQAKRTADGVGPGTINREVRYLALLLKEENLWPRIRDKYKRLAQKKSAVGKALSPEQARYLLETAQKNPAWNAVGWCAMLALNTGMRGEEIKGLRLEDVSLAQSPEVRIRRESTKTDTGVRRIPLNQAAVWAAARLIERANALGSKVPTHYLLPHNSSRHTKTEDPLHGPKGYNANVPQRSMRTAWLSLCEAAGLSGLRFHDLRHTFITRCGESGTPIEVVRAMVGHMSTEMTMYYMHLNDKVTRPVVDAVGAANNLNLADLAGMALRSKTVN